MARSKEELLAKLSECVLEMEEDEVVEVAQEYIDAGYPAFDGIMDGLVDGMNKASDLYDAEEYFVTDLLLCSDAMYAGLEILKPYLPVEEGDDKAKAVIGVVEGDTHDIGKNLVKMMMEGKGLEVIDLGTDVSPDAFVKAAIDEKCDIICLSALLTTTMSVMGDVVKAAEAAGIRDNVKIMIGGAPVTEEFREKIGADIYTVDAASAADAAVALCEA